ncbi:MAG: DNA gyrase subunit A [Bacteroidetes bacterium]|nr:DNA gyrase subunit A [Bacteroidota bacterium]
MESNIIPVAIETEMRGAYIDYSMSVIVSRALPDVRDGLKPVHRRVLYGMQELALYHDKPHKKSARIVGEVLGKFHPHSDTSVYDAMVRMAQEWSLRYILIDGQGNFGSIDGDQPAAMRYTEARFKKVSSEMIADLNKNTVDFVPNFDDSLKEPTVLPAKIPNLLINGSSGIAVGMATNMAPHNLSEVIDGILAFIDNNEITIEELMKYIIAPDFPTGGIIYGYQGVKEALQTGRGRIVMRGKATIDINSNGKEQIIVTEIPYAVNKALMIEKTAMLVNGKKIEGISDIRDESDKDGLRVVYDLKRDAVSSVVLNNLFKYTSLQTSFSVNNVALVKGKPKQLNLRDLILHFVDHRHEVVTRRTQYELDQAEKRMHILEGYLIALDNLDQVIALIKASKDPSEARIALMKNYELSEIQARAILDLRLHKLTGLEREKIVKEYEELKKHIEELKAILADHGLRMQIIKDELIEIKEKYGDSRRTIIEHDADDITMEDMIPNESMVITVSNQGYIKRSPLVEYKTQGRGGVGARGVSTKKDDFTSDLFVASAHDYLLVFTQFGKVYWKKVYAIPEGSKTSQGRAIQNLIQIDPNDSVKSILKVSNLKDEDYLNSHFIVMCTTNGKIKKTSLEAFSRPRSNGINAITINEGDTLLDVKLTGGESQIVMASYFGRSVRFNEGDVRAMGRTAAGVRGITLGVKGDHVIGMVTIENEESDLLVVSEKGYGKRSSIQNYRITKRGGKGVKTLNITDKTGKLVTIKEVVDADDLMIINKSGITIRMQVKNLRTMGRATQGVRLIRLNENDKIASVEKVRVDIEEENIEEAKDQEKTV